MRNVFSIAMMAALVSLLGVSNFSRDARAEPVVDLVWTATSGLGVPGHKSIKAELFDTLTLDIRVTADAAGISGALLSLEFDTDLENELDLIKAVESCQTASDCGGLTAGSAGVAGQTESQFGQKGSILTYEALTVGAGPVSTTFTLGTAVFLVSNVSTDGDDVFSGFFNALVDGIVDNASQVVASVKFNDAAVNDNDVPAVPSLSVRSGAVLVGVLILAALAVVRDRSRARG